MKTEKCVFYSDGARLEGLVLLPDDLRPGEKRSAVILNSGLQGLKEWVPARFWPQFLDAGYVCMAFDYRGFGPSEGEHGRMLPEEEIEDVRSAITFLQQHEHVDPERIGVLGWGLGGGVVISTAARDRRVKAVCTANGFGWGARTVRDACTLEQWFERLKEIRKDQVQRVLTGKSKKIPHQEFAHPGGAVGLVASQFQKDITALKQEPVPEFTLQSAEAYYDFRPELEAGNISPTPLLIVHGTRANFYSVDEARCVYEAAAEPKTLIWIEGGIHLEWIHPDSELSRPGIGQVVKWFVDNLPPTKQGSSREAVTAGVGSGRA